MYMKYFLIGTGCIFGMVIGVIIGLLMNPIYHYLVEFHTGDVSPAYVEILSKDQCIKLANDINAAEVDYNKLHPDDHTYILHAWCIP